MSAGSAPRRPLFAGLREDVARRAAVYGSDWRDGLHPKIAASTLFLFFACCAPAIAFGGLMAELTGGAIGTVEMLVATSACGVAYALFSAQPLTILGGTGPLLVFTGLLYQLCQRLGLAFLPVYAWVGLWTALFLIVLVAVGANRFIDRFTRFTDETFAALISLIFIVQAVQSVRSDFSHESHTNGSALLSLLIALGTYVGARNMARMRRSQYLRSWLREFFADFGPAIAVIVASAAPLLLESVRVRTLEVPLEFATTSGRGWRVNPFSAPQWVWLASAVPASLVAVLVYLDQNITARLVNSAQHRLRKGHGYDLDLLVVAVLLGVMSLFGLPWLVGATVRSLNHVRSLSTAAPSGGEDAPAPHIESVRENRVSPLLIHAFVGASLLATPILRAIPLAALHGLFLFMGVASMHGNQFFERVDLWFKDPAMYPSAHFLRRVPTRTVHAFTALQAACLVVLWVVKASPAGILFPLFIALLVPVRAMMPRWFDPAHVEALDAEVEPDEENERMSE